ncbi:unnamed protein product [Lampetra fluviatilis]
MEDAVQARAGETTDSIPGFPAVSTRALTPEPLRHLPERERTKAIVHGGPYAGCGATCPRPCPRLSPTPRR